MKKILKKFWFTGQKTIGIVVIQNDIGERKAYIGLVGGYSEDMDAELIADMGSPVHKEYLAEIIKALEGK